MLNYILPPIIIIVSVSVLILFLFRKAQQIPAQEFVSREKKQKDGKKLSAIFSAVGQFGLKILERIMHRSKLMALKFHNISNDLFHSIHEKRQRRVREQQEIIEKNINSGEVLNAEKKVLEINQPQNDQFSLKQNKDPRPLVREAVISSQQAKIREKNKLEETLIRRIAINPKDIEAYERLGDYYLESENFHDSIECFRQVLKLSPIHYKARLRIRRIEKIIK
jgi:tetratricopeptide (TPR) repeat protein